MGHIATTSHLEAQDTKAQGTNTSLGCHLALMHSTRPGHAACFLPLFVMVFASLYILFELLLEENLLLSQLELISPLLSNRQSSSVGSSFR